MTLLESLQIPRVTKEVPATSTSWNVAGGGKGARRNLARCRTMSARLKQLRAELEPHMSEHTTERLLLGERGRMRAAASGQGRARPAPSYAGFGEPPIFLFPSRLKITGLIALFSSVTLGIWRLSSKVT